jgi:hypothetical protein
MLIRLGPAGMTEFNLGNSIQVRQLKANFCSQPVGTRLCEFQLKLIPRY